MAKKPKSLSSASSSSPSVKRSSTTTPSSSASARVLFTSSVASNGTQKNECKLVLKIKSNEGMKRSVRQTNSRKKPKANQKKKIRKIDAKKPKKPPTAFFYFLEDFRKEFQEQNPDVKSMRDIGKACGEKWKTMTYEEKVHYYDIATEKRAEFDRATAEYNKKMESGEYSETDEESEFDE